MSNLFHPQPNPEPAVFCGIDISAATLAVAVQPNLQREFANTAAGHKQLIAWLRAMSPTRVSLEATGIYSLDLALALDAAEAIECAVLNPKSVHRFAQTLRRSKTDKADAQTLAEYSQRMPFVRWQPPSREALRLRSILHAIYGIFKHQQPYNDAILFSNLIPIS